ncbi:hypothetical protein FHS78_001361 [Parvibaculum indicum]|uniref:hypothetical protein n=1 Tax=Parvibaculum indicum TaxID=562969 RepID=UPI00141EBD6A|nr:hypothetical protein [Parvibaculum indicum]NIJ41080.1 hypothetical protein [Parvibaculum indicum]
MKPVVDNVLQGCFATLLMEVAPHLGAEYSVGDVSVMGLMLFMSAEEYDRAAEVRTEDNSEMRSIFAEAASQIEDAELRRRLGDASDMRDTSLRISALDKINDALKALLIDLQTYLEGQSGDWAAHMERRIWKHLSASAERRKLPHPAM